ncbi:MAG: translation elongation factor 4 [Planctomycetota bacterium]|nr:translation elongation factor 4 [Planctomycetota bacterium]
MPYPLEKIRNFCIIAHIDHGKSTLADRLLQATGTVTDREMQDQLLDDMDLERERGITIKARAVSLRYKHSDGEIYQLNLIDTPGHVDFTYEVQRSLQACEGALLLVDAAQGVEAQTMANFLLAIDQNLEIVPVLNKIDLPAAMPDKVAAEVEESLGLSGESCIRASAKMGIGISDILGAIVDSVPAPKGNADEPLQALIFDAVYDDYRGIIVYFRVINGAIKRGDSIRLLRSQRSYEVTEVGRLTPKMNAEKAGLAAGEVGYFIAAIKNLSDVKVGDTITLDKNRGTPLPGFRELKPMVFAGLYPSGETTFDELREAVEKLQINDASFTFEPESGGALGHGFRCGYLGMLHLEICQERLEREFDLDLVTTAPNVPYQITTRGGEDVMITTPAEVPPEGFDQIREPVVELNVMIPSAFVGPVMQLATERRGEFKHQDYLGPERCVLTYHMPMAEVVYDLFDKLKSATSGYGTMDYDLNGFRESDLVKVDILVHHNPCEALAFICHRSVAERRGRAIVKNLREEIPRHLFEVALQAAIGAKVIARESVKAMRKDVTAKCYGGDVSRKRKLLEKQKKGKKRMKMIGSVEVPQAAFMAVLKANDE